MNVHTENSASIRQSIGIQKCKLDGIVSYQIKLILHLILSNIDNK
jgi:hypothetical protein